MARLMCVYRETEESHGGVNLGRRQIPVRGFGDNLMMIMDMNSKGLVIDSPQIRGKELEEFTRKFNLLSNEELRQSLEIDSATFNSVLNQCVQCVGCRRRVEKLFQQLTLSGHPTLDPLVLKSTCILTISEQKLKTPQALGTLLYRHHEVLNNLLDSKLRNKTRCVLHSLDAFRTKPFSETWREVWSAMKHNCRDELAVIDTKELHEVLENYLKKHKFCQGCRTKIEKAYKILVGENTYKEKGFVAALYANIKKCHPDKHIHVHTNKVDFLDALIRRAEPEVNGSYTKQRERHAKTLEIAQEEVLTCVGMIMYERLRRIYISLREEERACQVLAAVGVHALCRSFDMFVEKKQGISNLELLYQQISRAEKAKELKREQKKLKKKMKKHEKKAGHHRCDEDEGDEAEEEEAHEQHAADTGSDTAEADEEEADEAVDVGDDCDEKGKTYTLAAACDQLVETEEEEQHNNTSCSPASLCAGQKAETALTSSKKKKKPKQKAQSQPQQQQTQKRNKKQSSIQQKSTTRSSSSCTGSSIATTPEADNIEMRASATPNKTKTVVANSSKCTDCLAATPNCPCDVKDSGYGSEPNSSQEHSHVSCSSSSCEGSVISCCDDLCHEDPHEEDHNCDQETCEALHCQHNLRTLSLQQMLADGAASAEQDEGNCYIPPEVVLEYQSQHDKVQQQRQQLRETLREKFALLCMKRRETTA